MTNIQFLVITLGLALLLGLPCFCSLVCIQYIIRGSRRAVKNKEGLGAWITSSGCEMEVGREWSNQKQSTLDHLFKCSTTILDSRHLWSWNYLPTHFQAWCVHIWILAPPHYVHLASTQVMIAPRPFLFLATLLFLCINVTKCTIKWKIKWRRPGLACKKSPTKKKVLSCISMVCSLECWAHKETAVFTLGQSYICPGC